MAEEKKETKKTPSKKPAPKKPKVKIPEEVLLTAKTGKHFKEIWINPETGQWFWKKEAIKRCGRVPLSEEKKFINVKL